MKINVVLSMLLAGVIIYTSISSFASSLLAFFATGVPMLSVEAIGLSLLIAAIMAGLFFLLTLWVRRDIQKHNRVTFPFITTLVSIDDGEEEEVPEQEKAPEQVQIDEKEFLEDPARAFREAEANGSVVVTLDGKPRFVLTIPLTDLD